MPSLFLNTHFTWYKTKKKGRPYCIFSKRNNDASAQNLLNLYSTTSSSFHKDLELCLRHKKYDVLCPNLYYAHKYDV